MIVYWCNVDLHDAKYSMTGLRRQAPYPVRRLLGNKYNIRETHEPREIYYKCPAHLEHMKNLYAIPAPFDCDLLIDKQPDQPELATSTIFKNNSDFNRTFIVRSIKNRLFSINVCTLLIPDSDDVAVSQMPAYLESNDFVDNTVIVPGTFNMGKWPRAIECSFHLKNDSMFLREGDPMYYLKFHTDEKIKFKEVLYTDNLRSYTGHLIASRGLKSIVSKMDYFYNIIGKKRGFKQRMIEEAKANVIGE